MKVVLNR